MTCHDVQHQLYPFLDGTLAADHSRAIRDHLAECSACDAKVEQTRRLEDRLRDAFRDEPVPGTLWSCIEADLEVTEPLRDTATPSQHTMSRIPWVWSAAAAAVVILAFSVMFLRPLLSPASLQARLLSVPVQDLHTFVVSQRALDITGTASQQVREWFWEKVDFSPPVLPMQAGKAHLVGGRLCHFLDRRVAAFMYSADGRYISLYVMPRQGLALPPNSGEVLEPLRATIHEVQGYTHILWSRTDLLYSLVSDLPREQLADMARAMMPVEQRRL
ncbi:MAG: zf-HC2 domain-containing protein [Candidatus Tectomicrobia bacterium]|nr:zf-HC2 domain-containing protein [Candidatus Tectomicrobia bacterium]